MKMSEIDTTNTAGRLVAAVEFVHRNMIQSADTLFEQVAEEIILLQAENEKLKKEVERLTAITGLCCNNQLTQKKLAEARQDPCQPTT